MKINFLSKRERRREFSGQLFMGSSGNSLFTASPGFFFYLHSCIALRGKSIEIACHA
jgi:hypothetical protein